MSDRRQKQDRRESADRRRRDRRRKGDTRVFVIELTAQRAAHRPARTRRARAASTRCRPATMRWRREAAALDIARRASPS